MSSPYFDSLIVSTNNLFPTLQKQQPTPFQILDTDGEVLMEMTSMFDLSYEQIVKVAYEPQENGEFNANSKQGTPFKFQVTATVVPMLDTADKTIENQADLISNAQILLDFYLNSDIIVNVRTHDYYYQNMTMSGTVYFKSAAIPVLFAEIMFQQVRVANVTFQPLPSNQVSNQTYASQQPQGQVQDSAAGTSAVVLAPDLLTPDGTVQ